jgi:predicted nucleic acid-binding protein
VIRYVVDSSALWRLIRQDETRAAWSDVITAGAVGSCHPQRTEFLRSARDLDEYEQMSEMFLELYADVPVPKTIWRWIEAAQYRLLRAGAHRAMSCVDLMICGTAAHSGLVVLHDDTDFTTASSRLPDLNERRVTDTPPREPTAATGQPKP